MQYLGLGVSEKPKLLSKTEYKEQDTIFKETGMLYSEYLEYITLKHQQQNIDDYVVWQTGMNTDDDSEKEDEEEKESEPCGACKSLEGQIFHITEVPEAPHKNCKCGTIPLRLLIGLEKINERLKKMEAELKKTKKREDIISSYYGQKDGPHPKGHTGTDFRTPVGTPIYSPVDGTVSRNNNRGGNGNRIAIVDEKKVEHHFYHMDKLSHLEEGSTVHKGDLLGYTGNTGRSTGPHVHYEVRDWKAGNTLDEQRMPPSEENLDYLVDSFYDSIYG